MKVRHLLSYVAFGLALSIWIAALLVLSGCGSLMPGIRQFAREGDPPLHKPK